MIFIYFCLSISNPFSGDSNSNRSGDGKTNSIIEKVNSKTDKCFEELSEKMNNMCVNLDSQKRKALARSIMICEFQYDEREIELPLNHSLLSDDEFISQIHDDNFKIFTTYFTSIDSICFQCAHEQLSSSNLKKILNVYKAVSLSTEFLIAARDNLDQTTKTLRTKLVDVQETIFNQASSISNMTELIKNTTEKLIKITNQASVYKNAIANAKYYLIAIGLSILASFVFTNVFMPVLFVTGIFLFIEINVKAQYSYYLTGKAFKYSYAVICIFIFLLSLWSQIDLIKIKIFGGFKKKRSRRMPRICE